MTTLLADPPRGRPILLTDPKLKASVRASRAAADGDKWNEVWDGVLVMPTLPNDEHPEIQCRLMFPLTQLFEMTQRGKVRAGVDITDRSDDWKQNFRGPGIALYLPDNPAVNLGSHWLGGPDFLVEIASPGDLTSDKLPFYAKGEHARSPHRQSRSVGTGTVSAPRWEVGIGGTFQPRKRGDFEERCTAPVVSTSQRLGAANHSYRAQNHGQFVDRLTH
ncbi:MAG TPA: Uma2 family endonuclease [Gemmataceae bacterium]